MSGSTSRGTPSQVGVLSGGERVSAGRQLGGTQSLSGVALGNKQGSSRSLDECMIEEQTKDFREVLALPEGRAPSPL